MTPGDPDALMTAAEIAAYLQYSLAHIYRMTSRHEIPHCKPRGELRFYRSDIDEWIRDGRVLTNVQVADQADLLLKKRRRQA